MTITMERQLDFMRTKDLGFDGDQIVMAYFRGIFSTLQIERLAEEIDSRPGLIEGVVGASSTLVGKGIGPQALQLGNDTFHATPFHVSPDFLRVTGIEILSGRGFGPSEDPGQPGGILLNETAARFLGPEDPMGRTLTVPPYFLGEVMLGDGELGDVQVIGIVEDFHYEDMRHTVGPTFLTTTVPWWHGKDGFETTLFRLDRADLPAAVEEVKALWKRCRSMNCRKCASSTKPSQRNTRPSVASARS
ncbi:MAG: ABC transporter permease [Gemmatimonadetes bacterium]|nr:ABC transporter permease [Gemmatimonadota bacterium]